MQGLGCNTSILKKINRVIEFSENHDMGLNDFDAPAAREKSQLRRLFVFGPEDVERYGLQDD